MRYRRLVICAGTLIVCALPVILHAQMNVDRNLNAGAFPDSVRSGTFFAATHAFTELQRGSGSVGEEQRWDVKAGLTIDLARWRPHGGLRFSMNAELLANPYSVTHFNPRGVYFEPVFGVAERLGGLDWELSAFHRCRHDVDNIDPPNSADINGTRYKRDLILSGWLLGVSTQPTSLGHRMTSVLSGRVEAYPVRSEERRPVDLTGPLWNHAVASATIGGRLGRRLTNTIEPYVRGWTTMVVFRAPRQADASSNRSYFTERAELGARFAGVGGNIDGFVAYERTFDDLSPPHARAGHVLFAGVRLAARGFM